jgi:hypothetical protein
MKRFTVQHCKNLAHCVCGKNDNQNVDDSKKKGSFYRPKSNPPKMKTSKKNYILVKGKGEGMEERNIEWVETRVGRDSG